MKKSQSRNASFFTAIILFLSFIMLAAPPVAYVGAAGGGDNVNAAAS